MNIVMLADWLPPDFGAVGQYALKFAGELAESGHHVTLVGLTSGATSVLATSRGAGSLRIRRVHRPSYNKQSLRGRALWTLRSNGLLLWHGYRELSRCDEVRFTGSPPYMIHFVMPLALLLRKRTRYRITDFHPECLMAEYQRVPLALRLLLRLTQFWRRRVSTMEVIGEDQRRICLRDGIRPQRIELRRDPAPIQFRDGERPARAPDGLRGRRIVLYSGNWGVAHDYQTFVEGMVEFERRHPGKAGVWVNATGSRVAEVCEALQRGGVALARTTPVPLDELAGVLLAADVHLICLRDRYVGYVLPSKVYACIDSARPVLFVGSGESDVHSLCQSAAASGQSRYRRVAVGDAAGVTRALEQLLLDERRSDSQVHAATGGVCYGS